MTKKQKQELISSIVALIDEAVQCDEDEMSDGGDMGDDMLTSAIDAVVDEGSASASLLQRRLRISYGRAARIMDELEKRGIIGSPGRSRPRAVLLSRQQWYEMKMRLETSRDQ